MMEILCKWLNQELKLSKTLDPNNFAKDFSNGYLIGEILHKYQMQHDFNMFLKKNTSIAKVNNFTRLQPTLKLLGISFDINKSEDLMQEKEGVATHLLYQLYVSLEKKKNAEISRTKTENIQPAAKAPPKKEHEIYSYQLPQVVRSDSERNLPKISQHYEDKCQQPSDSSVVNQLIQHKRPLKIQDKKIRMEGLRWVPHRNHNDVTGNQTDMMKLSSYDSLLNKQKRQQQRKEREAQAVQTEITQFEEKKKKQGTSGFTLISSCQLLPEDFSLGGTKQGREIPGNGRKLILQSNSNYLQEIRQRIKENAIACERREKRIERFLVEQFKATVSQQEAQREEQLVRRLTRQTKQEQRLAAQLVQILRQKDVILENRLFREQQYQERREKDFQEALDREMVLAQQAKLAREEEIRQELEFCNRIAAERAEKRHRKHSDICKYILGQVVDLATKVGEYRLLTGNLIPEKQMKSWMELFFSGLPLYESIKSNQTEDELPTTQDPTELKKQEILNNLDYDEYINMVGEWAWPKDSGELKLPPLPNHILIHVVQRLRNIVHPPIVESSSPSFPYFHIKACVLGKFCSGKTTCLAKVAEALGICVLSADTLIEEALKTGEELFTHTTQGTAAEKDMRNENTIPNELLVDIMVKAISQVPNQSGWILDGFPHDITQAHLLEKALGGSVDEENESASNTTNLIAGLDPPKPPPHPTPFLDLALLLDIPNECVVRRAYNHGDTDPAATISQPTNKNLYLSQIPNRITAFQEAWPELEKWFGEQQNILVRVNADVEEEELYSVVESILQQLIQKKHEALVNPPIEDVVADNTKGPSPFPTEPPVLTDEELHPTESYSSLKKEKLQKQTGNVSSSSMSNEDTQRVPKNQSESASSTPVSFCQLFVDEALPLEIAEYLCSYWDNVCKSYVNNIKQVMEQLRSQHALIDWELFNTRGRYKQYLCRPDLKQELVSQWQKDFNSIPDDMRGDEDSKAELHLRLDELCEKLWDIIDNHKEDNEQERASLMSCGWLEGHTDLLINHHSTLMQVELSRFWETVCLLRVYYWGMDRHVLLDPISKYYHNTLLETPGSKDKDERDSPSQSARSHKYDGEDKKSKLYPDSEKMVSKIAGQAQSEPVRPSHEKLTSDYEEALKAISRLISEETQQRETEEEKERLQEKENTMENHSASSKKAKKERKSAKNLTGDDSEKTETQTTPEMTHDQKVREKISKEYKAALTHEEKAAKVRIELVKDRGQVKVQSLHSRAQGNFEDMEKWFQARYQSEMKCIDQLSEVVCHHIEAGAELEYELVLEGCDFYLNGDCHLVAGLPPPPRPPPLEEPIKSTPTIDQLESLHHQLYDIAPSGLMSSFEFFGFLEDMVSFSRGRNILPEPWTNVTETQLLEIVSLLTDEFELVDWRRFLLSVALPWPHPSLTKLLDVLHRFKEADPSDTGYVNREQYLQTELWFSSERVQSVPDDPSEPLPYRRLANLHKLFFQLFADRSLSPPQLDYVSMLQYFAADSNPRQGLIRALSVVLGQHIQQPSSALLVKSMPSIDEATELDSFRVNEDYMEEDALFASSCIFRDQEVSIPSFLDVICHKVVKMKDNRPLPPGCLSFEEHKQHLVNVYIELGYKPEDSVPFSILSKHPYTQMLIETSTRFQFVNIHKVLLTHQDEGEA